MSDIKFGKVIDGYLEVAPTFIKRDGEIVYTNSTEEYAELGYKPVQYVDPPDCKDRNALAYHWEDAGMCCLQVWDEIASSSPLSVSEEEIEDMRAALSLLTVISE